MLVWSQGPRPSVSHCSSFTAPDGVLLPQSVTTQPAVHLTSNSNEIYSSAVIISNHAYFFMFAGTVWYIAALPVLLFLFYRYPFPCLLSSPTFLFLPCSHIHCKKALSIASSPFFRSPVIWCTPYSTLSIVFRLLCHVDLRHHLIFFTSGDILASLVGCFGLDTYSIKCLTAM